MENQCNETLQFRQGRPRQSWNVADGPLRRVRVGHPARNDESATVFICNHQHRLATMRSMAQLHSPFPTKRVKTVKNRNRFTRNVGFVR